MASPTTREAHERNLSELARRAIATHQIRSRGERRWLLQRPRGDGGWCWSYAAEVVMLRGGRVLVSGDVEPVIFAGYHGDEGEDTDRHALGWVADMEGGYLAEKATAGLKVSMEHPEHEVAAGDLLRRAADRIAVNVDDAFLNDYELGGHDEEEWDHERDARDRAVLGVLLFVAELTRELEERDPQVALLVRSAARLLRGEPFEDVKGALMARDGDPEALSGLGRVTDARVFYAQAVVQRLCALLDAEKAAEIARANAVEVSHG